MEGGDVMTMVYFKDGSLNVEGHPVRYMLHPMSKPHSVEMGEMLFAMRGALKFLEALSSDQDRAHADTIARYR